MFRRKRPRELSSIQQLWLTSFSLPLVLLFILFITFVTVIMFRRADRNIANLLGRAQTIAWTEYDRFFSRGTSSLTLLATSLGKGVVSDYRALPTVLTEYPIMDLWFITDSRGRVLLSSAENQAPLLDSLTESTRAAWQEGKTFNSTEVVTLDLLRSYNPLLAERAVVEQVGELSRSYGALIQVVAVPYRQGSDGTSGAIVGVHLLNNDNSIAAQIAAKIPDSFSTLSVGGIRVAGNLSSPHVPTYVGQQQTPDLISTIQQGKRFYGRVRLGNELDHLVVSDPIRDSNGRVIGAITTGHPSDGLASLKEDTVVYIILSALLCWSAVFVVSSLASRRWADPISALAKLARQIYEADDVSPQHLTLLKGLPPAMTREIENLQLCVSRMTISLFEKNEEAQRLVKELGLERNELERLAQQLQEANATLEARVEEKTMELRNAMLDLVASNNLKSKLLANTSHELRTPLNSIIGFSEMLTGGFYGELPGPQRDRVQIIAENARYLLKLINDLLDVSMVEQGKLTLELQVVDLTDLVTSALQLIRHDCDMNQIQITTELEPDLPAVSVDPTRIKQVLYNVLSNAVKFTERDGEITVQTMASAGEVTVVVRDTGIGVNERDQLYVFDEFYQAENTSYRKQAGFGLGLPLSKKLVELHGGRIGLKSILGKGTTITVTIPIK